MTRVRRVLAAMLSFLMLLSAVPAQAFENVAILEAKTEHELRLAVLGDEKWSEQFPNGLFNFIGTQYTIAENQKYQEIAIARQGGTAGEVSVTFKTIDVSAEYGKDYVIRVYENNKRNELAADENSVPLINSLENGLTNISAYPEEKPAEQPLPNGANSAADEDVQVGEAAADVQSVEDVPAVEGVADAEATSGAPDAERTETAETLDAVTEAYTTLEKAPSVASLKEVRDRYLGTVSDRNDWKTADKATVENLKQEYDAVFANLPGAKATITFAEGEYIKYFYIVPLNDKLSESEEQFMFTLESPTGGASRGEFYMGYANITDNEAFEASYYSFVEREVTASGGTATVKIQRNSGIYHNSKITVGTIADTAIEGADYVAGLTDIAFAPGVSEVSISVDILQNIYRTEGRGLYLVLTGSDGTVNADKAQCFVNVPKTDGAMTADAYNEASKLGSVPIPAGEADAYASTGDATLSASSNPPGGETLSPHGFSDGKGRWIITPEDFTGGNNGGQVDGSGLLKFDHTGGTRWARKSIKLYGTDSLELWMYNNGRGFHLSGDQPWVHCFYCFFGWPRHRWYYDEHRFTASLEVDGQNVDYQMGPTNGKILYKSLSKGMWNGTYVSVTSSAGGNNHSSPAFGHLLLRLRPYAVNVQKADTFKRTTYDLKDGKLTPADVKSYSPGSISIASIGSNVGNAQLAPNSGATAYRSDRIELQYSYSADNPDGKYATYAGVIVNGKHYSKASGATTSVLNLDAAFFAEHNLYDTKNLDITPVFTRNHANFTLNVNTANGTCVNTGAKSSVSLAVEQGDTIQNIKAQNHNAAMLPQWSSRRGVLFPFSDTDAITVVEKLENVTTSVSYTMLSPKNELSLTFSNPTLIVRANPNVYAEGFSKLVHTVDGVTYDMSTVAGKTAYFAKMEQVFPTSADPANPAAPLNPQMTLSFQYHFDETFGVGEVAHDTNQSAIDDRKTMFGTPSKAEVNIYSSLGVLRKTHTITPKTDSTFTLSGTLTELQCQRGDFATIRIYGAPSENSAPLQTREIAIDFLENSASSIVVTAPNGTKTGGGVYLPVAIRDANPVEQYKIQSFPATGFITKWADYSLDLNNDGNDTLEEQAKVAKKLKLLGYELNSAAYDPTLYWGNYFTKSPTFIDPTKVFYSFEKAKNETANWNITIKLLKTTSTVLDPTVKTDAVPVKDATVILMGTEVLDGADGNSDGVYHSKNPVYEERSHYLGQVYIHPHTYNFSATAGGTVTHTINTSEVMRPTHFTAVLPTTGSIDFSKKEQRAVTIEAGTTVFSYRFNSSNAGVKPTDSIIRIYDLDGKLAHTLKTGPANASGVFSYSVNSLSQGIKPGSTMTIAGVYKAEDVSQEFPEVPVGLRFKRDLTILTIAASFKTPLTPVLKLFGKMNSDYDLGLDQSVKDKFESYDVVDKSDNVRKFSSISFGFSKTFKKELGAAAKDKKDTDKDQDGVQDPESKGNDITDGKVNESLTKKTGEKGSDKKSVKEGTEKIKDKDESDKKPQPKQSGSGNLAATFNISLSIVLEEGQTANGTLNGSDYFSALILMAEATVKGDYTYTYVTPIGLPVMASVDAGGYASALLALTSIPAARYDAKYLLSGEGTISFTPTNYSMYGRFVIQPYLTIGAGAGFKFLNLWIYGNAKFDMEFYAPIYQDNTKSSGSGTVKFSAELALKVLFIQKKWMLYESQAINMFEFGPKNLANALSNPYNSFLYEELGTLTDADIMPRDYLENASEYGNYIGSSSDGGAAESLGVSQGEENVLKTGAYPYPQTKLLDLGNQKTLMLFIEDAADRNEKDRARLMYSIGTGNTFSTPLPVSDDGTFDESPDAFIIGGKVFITWSNADKRFTTESEKEILSSMNISAKWYAIDTDILDSAETVITKTFKSDLPDGTSDLNADINPMISYDEHSGRLLVYYTKVDYSSPSKQSSQSIVEEDTVPETLPATDKTLYGDLVNAYSVIAYRYADKQPDGTFAWSSTYLSSEGFDLDMATAYYGQRFLDLGINIDINEEEKWVDPPTELGADGKPIAPVVPVKPTEAVTLDDATILSQITGTTQTVTKKTTAIADPLIVDSDLITYNGLALFAYTADLDGNIKTTSDQKLYLQIYNFAEKTFHHPILLTNKDIQNNAQPKFVRTKDVTYLYWIQDGSVVYMNITKVVQSGLKLVTLESPEFKVYILDKTYTAIDGYQNTAIARNVDNPVAEFDIKSNGNGNILIWSEFGITYKNGIKAGELGSDDPKNIIKEKQIYASYQEPELGYVYVSILTGYPQGDGTEDNKPLFEFTYPDGDKSRYPTHSRQLWETSNNPTPLSEKKLIDYATFPDVNGSVGLVKAGDPMMLKTATSVDGYGWSTPIQLTSESGVNYSDLSFIVTDGGKIKASYIKYTQTLDEAGSFVDDTKNRKLAVNEFTVTSDLEFSGIILDAEGIVLAGSGLDVSTNLTNTGYLPVDGIKLQAFMTIDGVETMVNEWAEPSLVLGGTTQSLHQTFQMPQIMRDLSIGFRVKDSNGLVIGAVTKTLHAAEALSMIGTLSTTSGNRAASQMFVTNLGNVPFDDVYQITIGNHTLYSERITLAIGAEKELKCEFSLQDVPFSALLTADDGSVTSTASLAYNFGTFTKSVDLIRRAEKPQVDTMDNIKTLTLKANNVQVSQGERLELSTTRVTPLTLEKTYQAASGAFDGTTVAFESSDPSVVSVLPGGVLLPMDSGTATITVTVAPELAGMNLYDDGTFESMDLTHQLPQELIKQISFIASVPGGSGGGTRPTGTTTISASNGVAKTTVDKISKLEHLTVQGDATVTFNKAALAKIAETGGKNIEITVKKQENRFDIGVTVDGKAGTDLGKGTVTVALPRILGEGELSDNVVLYRMVDGTSVCMPFAKHQEGNVVFETNTLGSFELKYNKVSFTDVTSDRWYEKAVNFAAAREIIKGVGEARFAPDDKITRADFLVMIMRAYGIPIAETTKNGFADAGETYFTAHINTAKELGIVDGIGENRFAPLERISRQDMAVMLYNLLKQQGKLEVLQNPDSTATFHDGKEIVGYAHDAMTYLVDRKVLNGSENKLLPRNAISRGEVAQIIYNLIQ